MGHVMLRLSREQLSSLVEALYTAADAYEDASHRIAGDPARSGAAEELLRRAGGARELIERVETALAASRAPD